MSIHHQYFAVIKIGGSLLDYAGLGNAVHRLIDMIRPVQPLLIIGGGPSTDVIREFQQIHAFPDTAGHWLAIRSLTLNAFVAKELVTNSVVVTSMQEAHIAWSTKHLPILDPHPFLCEDAIQNPSQSPNSWDFTSDSIAARFAASEGAQHLILAKSVTWPSNGSLDLASKIGLVDPLFPKFSREIKRISWTALRQRNFQLQSIQIIE